MIVESIRLARNGRVRGVRCRDAVTFDVTTSPLLSARSPPHLRESEHAAVVIVSSAVANVGVRCAPLLLSALPAIRPTYGQPIR